jgi:hypothetical protein
MNVSASVTGLNGGSTDGVINWVLLGSETSGSAYGLKTRGLYAFSGGTNNDSGDRQSHILKLTDNSSDTSTFPDAGPAGIRYDIVSGSDGKSYDSKNVYGWFFPNRGIWALRESKLSASIPGRKDFITSSAHQILHQSASHHQYGNGLAMDTSIGSGADNAAKLVKALTHTKTHNIRAEENQNITSYFCRARAHQFNGSVNPTWLSGSDGRMTNRDMEGNPQLFITTVGLYDSTQELIMVGKLSSPLQKNSGKEATIKVNMTY